MVSELFWIAVATLIFISAHYEMVLHYWEGIL